MARSGSGRSFLLAMSLAELGFILLFMILLLSFLRMGEQEDEIEEITNVLIQIGAIDPAVLDTGGSVGIEPARVAEVVDLVEAGREFEEFKAIVAEDPDLPDEWVELIATTKQLISENEDLESRLVEANQMIDELAAASGKELAARNAQLKKWLRTAQEKVESLERRLEECNGELASAANCPSRLETAESEAAEVLKQLNYMRQRAAGFGHPPCWIDGEGRPDNLYEIKMERKTFSIAAKWPTSRKEAAQSEIFQKAIGQDLTAQQTRERLKPILEWSKKQTPECRHFVVLDDCAPSAGPRNRRLLIEDYFYKSREYFRCANRGVLDEE